eukprot:CAMPEP_0171110986 /NCGR_PEP_ID=MMETSP0766_2-20121228/73253_1 /TAXON_ID=439317 /ORGANISM="Gambierdiscus australes, Strain CAWD 149" /LENGTH=233 /DNA_ID=CAMNT_0011572917 /DNA_START=29 /DNA_END=730 /DNA_ORIENTATION=+
MGWLGLSTRALMAGTALEFQPVEHHPVHHPSALRNRPVILQTLQELLPQGISGDALEIASGTGAHVEVFAPGLPEVTWQPSEYVTQGSEQLATIDAHGCQRFTNVRRAVALDASAPWEEWPQEVRQREGGFRLVFVSNVFHITAWAVTAGILAGSGRALAKGGMLVTYGPYKIDGRCTTESNEAFDASLRQRNPEWGYRDVAEVEAEASNHGLQLAQMRNMPANNFLLQFVKA